MEVSQQTITTDVLVVGAGFAGCFAAIRARELGAEVVMVEQGKSGFAGFSAFGTHMTRAVLPDDDFDLAMKGTVLESDYMVDQEYAEGVLAETWDRIQEFLKLGADFRRDDSGQIRWYFKDTLYPPIQQRCAVWEPMGSYKHLMKVKIGAVRSGVRVIDRTVVTELLASDGKVIGAIGINKREGDFYIFKAKAVVMATGTSGAAACGNGPSFTADGTAMALRVGAELRGMEFGKIEVGGMPPAPGAPGPVFVTSFLGTKGPEPKIINAKGEEFVEKYELLRKIPGRLYCGPSWKTHIPAMLKEYREGRGPCYIDLRAPDKSSQMRELQGSFYDQMVARMRLSGYEFNMDKIKYEMCLGGGGSGQNGGIRINPYGVSTVPGLFAGGLASDMCCAPHYSIPANIMGSHASGRRAGESAAKYAQAQSQTTIDEGEVNRLKTETYAPLERQKGITEEEIRFKLIEIWPNLDLRNETRLNTALQEFRQLEHDAAFLAAGNFHELSKCLKIRNKIQVAQAQALAALARRETRMEHFREDYPLMDNKNWLKWVIVRGIGDRMETYLEDIPIERWKYRPEPTLVDRLQPRKEA